VQSLLIRVNRLEQLLGDYHVRLETQINQLMQSDNTTTQIINRMIADRRGGGHPNLR